MPFLAGTRLNSGAEEAGLAGIALVCASHRHWSGQEREFGTGEGDLATLRLFAFSFFEVKDTNPD